MCKNALGLDRIYFCSNSGIHEPAWLQGTQPGSPGQVQGDRTYQGSGTIFLCTMEFFPSYGKYFFHPPWTIFFLPPSKIFLSAMDKFSISSRLVIWNLDPRANVVRQEAQSRALRRPWKTLFLIWGWVLMMVMVMMMVSARDALRALPLPHCSALD